MRNNKLVAVIILFTVMLWSCSNDKPQELNHIPENATFVFTLNPSQLLQKSGNKSITDTEFYKNISVFDSVDMDADDYAKLMEFSYIFDDPKQSGVDFSKQFFAYGMANKNGWYTSMAVNFGIADASKFETMLTKATKDNMDSLRLDVKEGVNYMISTKVNNSSIIAWNNETAVIFNVTKGKKEDEYLINRVSELINQTEDGSIATNKSFVDFYENKKDISVWLNSDFILNRIPQEYKTIVMMQLPVNTKGIEYRHYISFENGFAEATSELILPDDLKSLIENFHIVKEDFDTDILKYLPNKSFINFSAAIDAHEFYRMIKYLYNERQVNVDGMESMAEASLDVDIEKIFRSINGEVVFNIHGISLDTGADTIENGCGNPVEFKASFLVKLDNDEVYQAVLKVFNDNKSEMVDGYYIIHDEGDQLFISMVDNVMMMTNDNALIIDFAKKKAQSPSLKDSEIAKYLNNYAMIGRVNLDFSSYDNNIQEYYADKFSKNGKSKLFNKLKELRLEPVNSYNTKVIMEFKDKKRNSLEVMFD